MTTRRDALFLLLAGLMASATTPAYADDGGSGGGGEDSSGSNDGPSDDGGRDDSGGEDDDRHEEDDDDKGFGGKAGEARDAVRKGKAVPLRDILKLIRSNYEGDIIHVDVNSRSGSLVYEVQLLDPQNRRLQVSVNAMTKKILQASFY